MTILWLGACAFRRDTFVIVGSQGLRAWSLDGQKFQMATTSRAALAQRNVAYGDGMFISVSDTGSLGISADGKTWTDKQVTNGQGRIIYCNDTFVVLGAESRVYSSSDKGVSWQWTDVTSGLPDSWFNRGFAFADGSFYISQSTGIFSSTDGRAWKPLTGATFHPTLLGYGKGLLVGFGQGSARFATADFTQWTAMAGVVNSATMFGMIYKPWGRLALACAGVFRLSLSALGVLLHREVHRGQHGLRG